MLLRNPPYLLVFLQLLLLHCPSCCHLSVNAVFTQARVLPWARCCEDWKPSRAGWEAALRVSCRQVAARRLQLPRRCKGGLGSCGGARPGIPNALQFVRFLGQGRFLKMPLKYNSLFANLYVLFPRG